MIRVVLADDQPLVRLGFRAVLEAQHDIEVVGEADDGAQAVALTGVLAPDVVLMDVRMPRMDGIEATRRITRLSRVLVLTTFDLDEYVFAALRAGAAGFLLKDVLPTELVHGVRVVASGDSMLAPTVTRRLIGRFAHLLPNPRKKNPADALTGRELDVLAEVARGLSNAEIAARLVIAEGTVKVHVGRVLAKLGLRDRVQLVVFAYENGLAPAFGGE